MNTFLWILQALLALHTAMGAVWKLSNSEQTVPSLKVIPHGAWLALCVFDLIMSAALILPALFPSLGILAPIAALYVTAEMLLFIGLHLSSRAENHGEIVYWTVVAIVSGFLAFGRLVLSPL